MEIDTQRSSSLNRADRSSNIELLRIICMAFLIAHHCVVHGGALSMENCINKWIGLIFVPIGKICFDAFVAISAWYTVDSKFKASRFFKIWFQILFYNLVFTGFTALLGNGYTQPITWRTWLGACFPIIGNSHGFAASYVIYYLCTPFLHYVAERLTKQRAAILVSILLLTQVFSTILGAVTLYTQPMTSEILLFVLFYFAALYLKRWPFKLEKNTLALGLIVLFFWGLGIVSSVENALRPDKHFFAFYSGISGSEMSLNNIIAGLALFFLFTNIKVPKMPRMNLIASTTFGILLFHDHNYFRPVVWGRIIQTNTWLNVSPFSFVIHILVSVMIIFTLGAFIDFIRQRLVVNSLTEMATTEKLCDWLDAIMQQEPFDEPGEKLDKYIPQKSAGLTDILSSAASYFYRRIQGDTSDVTEVESIPCKVSNLKYMILTVLTTGCYAGLLFNRTMPFSEGWYTYYSQCINGGEVVYRDFDYLFTPFYIYFISIVTKLLGYKIIILRIIGIFFFCIMAILVFLIFREVFSKEASAIASIVAVIYHQSQVGHVYYDYVVVMNIFACITILFLVKAVKNINEKKKRHIYLICAGIANSLFCLVKQNMGLVFFMFALMLIFAVYLVKDAQFKQIFCEELYFLAGFAVPIVITSAFMIVNGSFSFFLNQTGASAIAAKGGIPAILFGWFKNNSSLFKGSRSLTVAILIAILISYLPKHSGRREISCIRMRFDSVITIVFAILCVTGFLLFANSEKISRAFSELSALWLYGLFQVIFFIFVALAVCTIVRSLKGKPFPNRILLYIVLSGSYIAISWGCGMSGGLAEGQATIGVAFIVALILDNLHFRSSWILSGAFVMFCLLVTLQSAAEKMNNTYNWWGLGESDFWDSTECSEDIEILQGIHISNETLSAYETVYHVISNNTDEHDPIYCFPQIPIFYSICDRTDPGVRAKVQWFDVVSDSSIDQDMLTIEQNPPAAILIYETSEYAYSSHEELFRAGEISATRRMKQFLLNYAMEHDYTFYGRISAGNNNNFLLYYAPHGGPSTTYELEGDGTYESPFLINGLSDLFWIKNAVDNGNDFSRIYFRQTHDINLASVKNWEPIGKLESGFYFKGIYDGAGHVIENMTVDYEGENVGFFGQLGGIVCNLGFVNCKLNGACVGTISSHAVDGNAMIINCYADSEVSAFRAGGIADNFCGSVINCISYSSCDGEESAGAISYAGGYSNNVFGLYDGDHIRSGVPDMFGDPSVTYCSEEQIESEDVLNSLNNFAESEDYKNLYSSASHSSWVPQINLHHWDTDDADRPILSTRR